jgi:fibrillarin-like rRNA methylase
MKIINHSIIRRYEHAFLLWKILNQSLIVEFFDENFCYLIEIEKRTSNVLKYQASTTTLITHLSDIFRIASLRAVEWARVWSKPFIIECGECRRPKNLVPATIATKFRRKTREKNQLFSTTLSILKRFSICLRNIHWINVNFLYFYFVFNHQNDVVAVQRICICLSV